jgi:hypothetical protein
MAYVPNAPAYPHIYQSCRKCQVKLIQRKHGQHHAMPTHCVACLKARRLNDKLKARQEAKRAAAMKVQVEAPSCLVTTAPVRFPLEVEAPVGDELPPASASVPRSRIDENAAPTQRTHEEAKFKRQKLNDKGTNQSGAQVARLQPLIVISKSGNSNQPMLPPVLPDSELMPTICLDELSAEVKNWCTTSWLVRELPTD